MSPAQEPSVVTFLFTDIVGSTQLHDTLGDEAAQEIVRLHNQLVRAEVARHGGSEVKAMGDGFMIAFRSVTGAINCAIGIQRAIDRHNREQPTLEFMVRMGLNSGEAIQEDEDFFGTAVIVAARIAALADGGEILTSAAVKQLAPGMRGITYRLKGDFALKGLRETYQVYEVTSGATGRQALAPLRRPPFIGRERELTSLDECLEQAASGSGVFVLLTGESGVGKTRLAEESARHARTRGFRVYRGRCYSSEGVPPYTPFVEVLRDCIHERSDETLQDDLADHAEAISRLVPELARRIAVGGAGTPLPPEQERFRLLEAVRHLLEQTARRRPLLLLLEDLHWADAASGLLLRHLAPCLSSTPMMVLGTGTAEGAEVPDALSAAVAEFGRLQAYRRIPLAGLSAIDIAAMLGGLGGGAPDAALVGAVYEQTEGNPFFVTELINHLDTEGLLLTEAGAWRQDFSPSNWEIPESVRVVIRRRVDALTEETRRLLTLAAVAGRDFSYDLLEAVDEVPAESLLDSLDEGVRMGMIEETQGAAARFRFAHQLTRQTLYDRLTGLRRQRYHLRLGEALEGIDSTHPEEIAYHLCQAGSMAPTEKTRNYLALAGDGARRTAAWEAAAGYYAEALELTPTEDASARAGLLRRLGEAESGRGNWENAVASLGQALDLFESLGDAETVGWIAYALRRLYGARGQFVEAAEVVERGLAALGDDDCEARARLLAQAGFIRSAFGESEEAERLLSLSMETAQRLENPAAMGFAAFISGMHCLNYTRLAEAADWLKKGTEWSLAGDDPWSASQGSSFRRHILFTLGRIDEAGHSMDEEERLARRSGNFLAVCETRWISSGIACLRGELEKAEDCALQLLDLIEASHADSGVPGALINLAYVRFLRGDEDGFEELLSRAIDAYDRMPAAPIDDPRPVLLLLRALAGRTTTAATVLPNMKRYFDFDAEWTTSLGEARATLATALGVLGEAQPARDLYGPLKEWTTTAGYVLTGASSIPQLMSRALAMAASAAGLHEAAVEHFETAIREARQMDAATELAEASYSYAVHLLERMPSGDRDYGLDLLGEAHRTWQRLGMAQRQMKAEALAKATRTI